MCYVARRDSPEPQRTRSGSVCGRSAMSGWINSTSMGGAFSSGFSAKYRMLDHDPYWVDFPQFAHCNASKVTVACTVPKP
ncbi:hypothetical protein ADZ36_02800 [Streptomyces fradiae]|uniref:Uncharacterized protein n=1 Tax=Streptomyces fradiae TaxID=1906 RepID=A0ACC4WH94_STRFR|nr:hypothetical protein ADZ36_02800 [Streptomyces fradiae]